MSPHAVGPIGANAAPSVAEQAVTPGASKLTRNVLTADQTRLRVRGDRRRLVVRATGTGEFWNAVRSSARPARRALRIRDRGGRVRAVTVTKNIVDGIQGVFQ